MARATSRDPQPEHLNGRLSNGRHVDQEARDARRDAQFAPVCRRMGAVEAVEEVPPQSSHRFRKRFM